MSYQQYYENKDVLTEICFGNKHVLSQIGMRYAEILVGDKPISDSDRARYQYMHREAIDFYEEFSAE